MGLVVSLLSSWVAGFSFPALTHPWNLPSTSSHALCHICELPASRHQSNTSAFHHCVLSSRGLRDKDNFQTELGTKQKAGRGLPQWALLQAAGGLVRQAGEAQRWWWGIMVRKRGFPHGNFLELAVVVAWDLGFSFWQIFGQFSTLLIASPSANARVSWEHTTWP